MVAGPVVFFSHWQTSSNSYQKKILNHEMRKTGFQIAPIAAFSIMVFAMCFIPIDGASVLSTGGFNGDFYYFGFFNGC